MNEFSGPAPAKRRGPRAAVKRSATAEPVQLAAQSKVGPTDISDPQVLREAKKAMVWIGIAALVVLTIFLAQPLLVIFGGLVFATMIDGGARLIGRVLPIPRGWRVAIVLILAVLFLAWSAYFAGSQLAAQAAELPRTVEAQFIRGANWFRMHGIPVQTPNFETIVRQAMGTVGQLTRFVGGIIGGATTLFLIVVLGIYISAEPRLYQRGLAWMLPMDQREHFQGTLSVMGYSLRRLLAGRLLGMLVEGVATGVALFLYGVPMSGLLGLLTGLLAFLPNIGAPVSGIIMVLVGFSGGADMGLFCILVYAVVQTVDGNLIVPMVAKKTVDLAPALVLGTQLIMGALFGILGLALADPMVALIKIWLERHAALHQDALNGESPPGKAATT